MTSVVQFKILEVLEGDPVGDRYPCSYKAQRVGTDEVGILGVMHTFAAKEKDLSQYTWVLSCYLDEIDYSPFGEINKVSRIKVKVKKDSIVAAVMTPDQQPYGFYSYTDIPSDELREDPYFVTFINRLIRRINFLIGQHPTTDKDDIYSMLWLDLPREYEQYRRYFAWVIYRREDGYIS